MSRYEKNEIYDKMLSEDIELIKAALIEIGDNTTEEDTDWAEQTLFIGTIHEDYSVKKAAIKALGDVAKNTGKIRKDVIIPYLIEQSQDEKLNEVANETIVKIEENVK